MKKFNYLAGTLTLSAVIIMFCYDNAYSQARLQKQGTATQITIDGKPMLLLCGELSNSAATCETDIINVMRTCKTRGLNTVLVPAQWDLIEPEKGKFDFSLPKTVIEQARKNDLKVIFLWFGAWKNSMSCYAPLWFKEDTKTYPRAITKHGKPLEIASAFSENVLQADKNAFSKLMNFISETDSNHNTVIMMQIENEIGMLEDARDYSAKAQKAFESAVPDDLVKYIKTNEKQLHPHMLKMLTDSSKWTSNSHKTINDKLKKGATWTQVFGNSIYADEIFMAYYHAKYVEQLAIAARKICDMPLYVNAALNSRGRKPGEYPSAGPLAHLTDIWHCAAPSIDILAPDIYDTGFKNWAGQYKLHNNPLFIPESRFCRNSGVRALYAFGEHDALGFSPFDIDHGSADDQKSIKESYAMLEELSPLLLKYQGKGLTHGLLFDSKDRERIIVDGDITLTCRHNFTLPWDPRATDGSEWPEGGGIIIKLADMDYLIAGNGIVVEFMTNSEKKQEEKKVLGEDGFAQKGQSTNKYDNAQNIFKGKRAGIGYVDEVAINKNGTLKYLRRENGDQSHQGRHARISVGEYKILHVKLYKY